MKRKNCRLLFAAFALIGMTAYASAQQGSTTQSYQQGNAQGGTMSQDQNVPPANGDNDAVQQGSSTQGNQQDNSQPGTMTQDQNPPTNPVDSVLIGGNTWTLDTSSPTQIMFNQTPIQFSDAQPGLINGQLMIPVRAVSEQAGAIVHWNNDTKTVEIDLPNESAVTLTSINQDADQSTDEEASGSGQAGPSASPSDWLGSDHVVIFDGHAYMPLYQYATAIDGSGDWEGDTATITLEGVPTTPPDSVTPDMTTPDNSGANPGYDNSGTTTPENPGENPGYDNSGATTPENPGESPEYDNSGMSSGPDNSGTAPGYENSGTNPGSDNPGENQGYDNSGTSSGSNPDTRSGWDAVPNDGSTPDNQTPNGQSNSSGVSTGSGADGLGGANPGP